MNFNGTFTLAHPSRTADGQGGFTVAFVNYSTTERGRMSAASDNEVRMGAQLEERITHVFFCRVGAGVVKDDQITDSNGVNYLVLGVKTPSGHHIEAQCREVQR
jgi:Phage head-tail joining protein